MATLEAIEREAERLYCVIAASENWAPAYSKAPEAHAKLIKLEAKLERKIREYFRTAKGNTSKLVNWSNYRYELAKATSPIAQAGDAIKAYDVVVNIDDSAWQDEEAALTVALMDPITTGFGIGAQGAQEMYQTNLGLGPLSTSVQERARDYVTNQLAGKLNQTTRDRVQQAIQTSLANHETIEDAASRVQSVINDPSRAMVIARTESVNAWGQGTYLFATKAGATSKTWQAAGNACEICGPNDGVTVNLDDSFPSGDDNEPAHPNCRCTVVYNWDDGTESDDPSEEDL